MHFHTQTIRSICQYYLFQSTHPRGMRPCLYKEASVDYAISIHTPTGDATKYSPGRGSWCDISTHTSTGNVTSQYSTLALERKISTLTSTVDATLTPADNKSLKALDFNPHTHAGCDDKPVQLSLFNLYFNLHIHAGCDEPVVTTKTLHAMQLANYIYDMLKKYFNPRIHVRCNVDSKYMAAEVVNFNPHNHAGCDSNDKQITS